MADRGGDIRIVRPLGRLCSPLVLLLVMALPLRCVAIVLLFGIVTADLGAAACLLDCKSQNRSTAQAPKPSCHETAGRDSSDVQLTGLPVVCHHDHQGVAGELSSTRNTQALRSFDAASLDTLPASSSATVISETLCHPAAHRASLVTLLTSLPLRL
jgi:hypothetical protein